MTSKPPEGKLNLTSKQRAAFFSRDKSVAWPTLAGLGIPPVQVGYVHRLSSRLSFEITKVSFKNGRWSLDYKITDDREERYYLMPGAVSFQTDEKGHLLGDMPPEEEIGYTQNPKKVRADTAPSVPPNVQNVLVMRAKLHDAEHDAEHRSDRVAEQRGKQLTNQLRRLQLDAAKCGVDIAPRLVQMIQAAKEEIAAKRAA